MNITGFVSGICGKALRPVVTIIKEKPTYVVGFGLALLTVGDITMIKAVMESSNDIEEVSEKASEIRENTELSVPQKTKSMAANYIQFGGKVGKRIALPVLLKAVGVGAIVGGANQLNVNALAAGATASMFEAHLNNLYKRIEEKYGKEAAEELRYNIKETEVEEEVVDKDGKTKIVKKVVKKGDPTTYEPLLERYYEASNPTFDRGLNGFITNIDRVRNAVIWAQKKYDAGYIVTWNDLFGSIGFQRIRPGYNWGWDKSMPGAPATIDLGINLYPQTNDEAAIWGDCVLLRPNCFKLYDVDDSPESFKTTIYGTRAIDCL